MRQKSHRHRVVWHLIFSLTLAVALCLMGTSLASAQNPADYFQFSYDPVTFDKQEINGSEVFHVTITGRATCTKDLPMSASEATITSQVVAKHAASGATVTLNSSYTVTIKPFPSKEGETAEISQAVPLQFPAQAASGDYKVIGKIVEAMVKVLFAPVPVTDYLPQEQQMGTVKYTASESTAAPETPSAAPETPSASPPPSEPAPAPTPTSPPTSKPTPTPTPTPAPPEQIIPWWVWLIVVIAAASITTNVVLLVKRRAK